MGWTISPIKKNEGVSQNAEEVQGNVIREEKAGMVRPEGISKTILHGEGAKSQHFISEVKEESGGVGFTLHKEWGV